MKTLIILLASILVLKAATNSIELTADGTWFIIKNTKWVAVTNQYGNYKIVSSNYVMEIVLEGRITNIVTFECNKTNLTVFYSPPIINININELQTNLFWYPNRR